MTPSRPESRRFLRGAAAALALVLAAGGAEAADPLVERANRGLVEIVTGSVDGTSVRMAEDLADVLDDGATRRVLPVIGKGAFQNLADLKVLRGVDLAIVQTDVLDYARDQHLYANIDSSVTYIAKLNNDEFHLLARSDIHGIADLSGRKVNFGTSNESTAFTAPRLFDLLKVQVEPTAYGEALALEKLKRGEIAAMAVVVGKPAPLFATIRPEDGLHFLAVPLKGEIAANYIPARLGHDDYPGLIPAGDSVDTVAVGTVLIAAGLAPDSERYRNVANFVEAFFTQFPKLLEAPHHPKWREVNLTAELPNWRRFPPAEAWIKRNGTAPVAMSETELHQIFVKFLDERTKASGHETLTAEQKDELYDQFRRWKSEHRD
ncbi:MAG TPA: TAXI family TRAP transporter solute-binding subunit [Stellaceae bacterium]|nr:TAXI family TRAP transporter solute-binding subunit [Stellaceae bacterium]